MLSQISTTRFLEWVAYAELEPFDEERQDYRIASVVQALAAIQEEIGAIRGGLGIRTNRRDRALREFVLKFGEGRSDAPTRGQQTPEQARAILQLYAKAFAPKKKKPPAEG